MMMKKKKKEIWARMTDAVPHNKQQREGDKVRVEGCSIGHDEIGNIACEAKLEKENIDTYQGKKIKRI